MTSDKFTLNSDSGRMAAARYATEDFARQMGLDAHSGLRLNLLVEETLGMVKNLVDEFYGQIWFTGEGSACQIHLEATANLDEAKKRELISASTSGRNAAARGFMAMLGDIISQSLYAYGKNTIRYGIVHVEGTGAPLPPEVTPIWSLQSYRLELDQEKDQDAEAGEAWDELEKSIVGNLADDVTVGIRGDRIEMVISRDFGKK